VNHLEPRPKLILKLTAADKALEMLGWISLLAMWVLIFISYTNLPDTIPVHYNITGQADGFGRKGNIISLPIIATVLFVGLTILNKYPHIFNYPASINADNAHRHYTNATRMIRFLKLVVVVIFGLIALQTIRSANGQANELGKWFLPLSFGLIFIPIVYFLVKSFKMAKE
jgi:uncharacterized membrane protein